MKLYLMEITSYYDSHKREICPYYTKTKVYKYKINAIEYVKDAIAEFISERTDVYDINVLPNTIDELQEIIKTQLRGGYVKYMIVFDIKEIDTDLLKK